MLAMYYNSRVDYQYDTLGRLTKKTINAGANSFETSYSYVPGNVTGATTSKLSSISNNGIEVEYEYDANGNITKIIEGGGENSYYYNELNELIQEDIDNLSKSILYSYDLGGNIIGKTEIIYGNGESRSSITYEYDSTWKDKLKSYNGKLITYDAIGNPLTYDGYTYSWEEGRKLKSITGNGKSLSFKYNDQGIRTEKTVDGVTTKYYLSGDKVILEDNGIDKIYYTYDSNDNLVSMNLNGIEYYYIRNGQEDIIGLFDSSGTEVVRYYYDSWGKLISIEGTLKDTVGVKNPYRYRGYRYDTEIGLYYLQSRYYNPEWGRFINGDGLIGQTGELLSHNLFVYCMNNPVNNFEQDGQMAAAIVGMYYFGWANAWNPAGLVMLGVATVAALAGVAVSWDKVGRGLSYGMAWISKQARTVSNRVADSFAKSVPRTYRSPKEVHHLVAKAGPNAKRARDILNMVGIGINSSANLIAIKTSLHRRLHTNDYYGYANSMIINAFNRGKTATARKTNVYAALAQLRAFISGLDAVVPW